MWAGGGQASHTLGSLVPVHAVVREHRDVASLLHQLDTGWVQPKEPRYEEAHHSSDRLHAKCNPTHKAVGEVVSAPRGSATSLRIFPTAMMKRHHIGEATGSEEGVGLSLPDPYT